MVLITLFEIRKILAIWFPLMHWINAKATLPVSFQEHKGFFHIWYWIGEKVPIHFRILVTIVSLSRDVLVSSDHTMRRWKGDVRYVKMFYYGLVIGPTVWELKRHMQMSNFPKNSHVLRLLLCKSRIFIWFGKAAHRWEGKINTSRMKVPPKEKLLLIFVRWARGMTERLHSIKLLPSGG